jgi:hypothetical protein
VAHRQVPTDPKRLHRYLALFCSRLEQILSDFAKEETSALLLRLQDYVGRNNEIAATVSAVMARAESEGHLYVNEKDDPFSLVDLEYLDYLSTIARASTIVEQRTPSPPVDEEKEQHDRVQAMVDKWLNGPINELERAGLQQEYARMYEEQRKRTTENSDEDSSSSSSGSEDSEAEGVESHHARKAAPIRRRAVSRERYAGGRPKRGGDPDDDDPKKNNPGDSRKDGAGDRKRGDDDRPGRNNRDGDGRRLDDLAAGEPVDAQPKTRAKLNPTAPPFTPLYYPAAAATEKLHVHYAAKEALDAIPVFSGKIEEYPGWKNVARDYSLLEGVPESTKLNALKNKLGERPKKLVQTITSLDPRAVNHVFDLLDKEYGRPRDIVMSQRKRI